MDTGKVSVIMPAYNAASTIARAIKSVIDQTYPDWELLVIDDLSTDHTVSIVQEWLSDKRIRLMEQPENLGPQHARNRGIELATGQYIAFLDADDEWLPMKLFMQIDKMNKHVASVSYSSYLERDVNTGEIISEIRALPILSYSKLLKANYIGNLTGMYDAMELGKIFCPDLPKRQDWGLWLEAIKRSKNDAIGIVEPLAIYSTGGKSLSSNKIDLIKHNYQVYRKVCGFGELKSSWFMAGFLFEQLFVKSKQRIKIFEPG